MTHPRYPLTLSTLLFVSALQASPTSNDQPVDQNTNLRITTASQTSESIHDTTADISVITSEDIAQNGDQTAAEAISHISGITVTANGGLGQPSTIFVRGQSSGSLLVLLDGMRLNDPSTTDGRANLEHIMTNDIAQIEIIKGGSSSIWGADASAGVINIITKTPKSGIHGTASLEAGSYATRNAHATLSYGDKRLTAQLTAGAVKNDGFSALAPRDAENDGYDNKTVGLKLGYAFDETQRIDLSHYNINAKGDYDDALSMLLANDDYSRYDSEQENSALSYRFGFGDIESTVKAGKGEFARDYYTNSYGEAQNQYRSTIKEASWISGCKYTEGKATLGIEGKEIEGMNNYISSFSSIPSESAYKNRAAFLSNIYHLGDATLIETNLRYDDFDTFDDQATYKIGIKHDHAFMPGFTTKANYYTAFDAPSAYQLANAAMGELLTPSYSEGFDITAGYKELLALTYFHTKTEDAFEYDMSRYGYYNIDGKEKFSGVEIGSSHRLPKYNIVLGANYTSLFDYERYDGTTLSNRAEESFNVYADYYMTGGHHFGITGQYIGDRVDVSTEQTGNYTVWNLHYDMQIKKEFEISVNAKNIFDKEYETVYGYATEGRSIYGKIAYSF